MSAALSSLDPGAVLDRVKELLGPEGATIRGNTVTAAPASDEETSGLLRVARERRWRTLPLGHGVGHDAESRPDLIVSTLRMTELLEHGPADLMCRARAGHSLGDLQEALGGEKQWLALDPPGGSTITLGGIVATGTAGPLQVQYGRPRDQVLGLTLVDGDGRILSLGGRVVKNVAGFDLVRLAAGSRGALGVITEVTFRVYAVPEEDRTLVWSWEDLVGAWESGRSLPGLALPLTSAELVSGRWAPPLDDSGCRVVLRLTGSKRAVDHMFDVLRETVGHPLRELKGEDSRAAARVLSEGDGSGPLSFRLHALPSRGRVLLSTLASLPLERLALHLLSGTFRGTLAAGARPEAVAELGGLAASVGGTLRPVRGPPTRPIGDTGARLSARIVAGFDPGGILPGAWRDGPMGAHE